MKDRFTRGFIAGILASLVSITWNLTSYYIGLSDLRYLDFAAVLTYGRKTKFIWESIFSLASVIFVCGLLGVIFIYLITLITSTNLFLKGFLFGVTVWFSFYAITLLFKTPELAKISFLTAFSNFIGAAIYGIVLAYALIILDRIWIKN